jgi:hypothetical protein
VLVIQWQLSPTGDWESPDNAADCRLIVVDQSFWEGVYTQVENRRTKIRTAKITEAGCTSSDKHPSLSFHIIFRDETIMGLTKNSVYVENMGL